MAREWPVATTLPPPVPRGRLLDTIEVLPGINDGGIPRWVNGGVTWNPWPCRGLQTALPGTACEPPTEPDDWGYTCEPAIVQTPFKVYDTYGGKTLGMWRGPGDVGEQIGDFLEARGDLMESWAFARELANGTAGSTLSLRNTAHSPGLKAFGAAVTAKQGLAYLEDDLARTLRGGRGIIHIPPGLTEFLDVKEFDEDGNARFHTRLGHLVVADAGYVDMPQPTGGGASSGTNEDWMYASGPVWYASTGLDLMGDTPNSYTNISTNTIRQWLEGYGILVFDPCPVTAVLVTYT